MVLFQFPALVNIFVVEDNQLSFLHRTQKHALGIQVWHKWASVDGDSSGGTVSYLSANASKLEISASDSMYKKLKLDQTVMEKANGQRLFPHSSLQNCIFNITFR